MNPRTRSTPREVVQIVPTLPPRIEGVGTFALRLAEELARPTDEHRPLVSRFVVGDPEWSGPDTVEGFSARPVAARDPDALVEALGPDPAAVLIHYVGYGYHHRGAPEWLVAGVERYVARCNAPRVTVFHEVWSTGPPWRSSFWTHPAQRRLAGRLSAVSGHRVTTLRIYADLLARVLEPGADGVTVMPMTSQVGEPDDPLPPSERPPRMAVFGGAGNRAACYRGHADALERACRGLGIDEILDLGPGDAGPLPCWDGLAVRALGALPAAEVSAHLLSCRAGFATYPPPFLAKSSVFAAYCAHGLAPVCPAPGDGSREGLEAGRHYLRPDDLPANPEDAPTLAGAVALADAVAARALSWYRPHRWTDQGRLYRRLLVGSAPESR